MTKLTGKQFAARVRAHTGKVEAPVIVRDDVRYLLVEKKDLIEFLLKYGDEPSPMYEVGVYDGVMRVDASTYR